MDIKNVFEKKKNGKIQFNKHINTHWSPVEIRPTSGIERDLENSTKRENCD